MADARTELTVLTSGEASTASLAAGLAAVAPEDTTFGLVGPLGAGKTCFVRGLARGLGLPESEVASPSFVYLVEYAGGRVPLAHADLYRFEDLDEEAATAACDAIGLASAVAGSGVVAVEWWDRYRGPAPQRLVVVEFSIESAEDRRLRIVLEGSGLDRCEALLAARGTERQ